MAKDVLTIDNVEVSSDALTRAGFEGEEDYAFFNFCGRFKFGLIYNVKRLLHFLSHGVHSDSVI